MVNGISFNNQLGNITRFREVDANVLRGAEPKTVSDLAALKSKGVDTVISFKYKKEEQIIKPLSRLINFLTGKKAPLEKSIAYTPTMEAAACEKLGIKFVNIPLNVFNPFQGVSKSKIAEFLQTVSGANGKVYIHCRHGVERTGLMSAVHKVSNGYVSAENAVKELASSGFRKYMYPSVGFKLSVGNLAKLLKCLPV